MYKILLHSCIHATALEIFLLLVLDFIIQNNRINFIVKLLLRNLKLFNWFMLLGRGGGAMLVYAG